MDFKGFKKVQEDDKMATMAHPSGHEVKIVKSSLSSDLRKRLQDLPLHQADPKEEVKDPNLPQDSNDLPFVDLPVVDPNASSSNQSSSDSPFTPIPASQAPTDSTQPVGVPTQPPTVAAGNPPITAPAPANPNPITGQPSTMGAANQFPSIAHGEAAAQEQRTVAAQTGADLAAAAVAHNKQLQAQQIKEEAHFAEFVKERDAAVSDIQNHLIKPNQYLTDLSGAGKAMTALGLMLGGYGAGLKGGPNMALDFLNNQINRNLEAQKSNMGVRENLLSALNQKYHNQMASDNMYKAIMLQKHANDLEQVAAKSGISQANPNFHMAMQSLAGQAQELTIRAHKLAMQDEVESPAQQPSQQGGIAPGQSGQWGPALDNRVQQLRQYSAATGDDKTVKDIDSRYVPGVGLSKVPLNEKDREYLTKGKNLSNMFEEAQGILKQTGTGTFPYSTLHETAGNKTRDIQLNMGEIAQLSRFTGEENKIYKQSVPDLGGTHFTNADQAKLNELQDSHERNVANFYKQKGLPPPPERRVNVIGPDQKPYTIPKSQASRLPSGWKVQ